MDNYIKTVINGLKTWVTGNLDRLKEKIDEAKTTANEAKTTANEAKTTVNMAIPQIDSKANVENPEFNGAFSQNRKTDTIVGFSSHAEGSDTTASGFSSHAEGSDTTASGPSSHAEGSDTTASGISSHAEGSDTTASGISSHAEGSDTTASGISSHAEGSDTTASGLSSYAEGVGIVARGKSQHVEGEYNLEDVDLSATKRAKYAHIVGNGTSDESRSNAHTLDWNGVGWFAGGLKVGGTGQYDKAAVDVALKTDIPNTAPVVFTDDGSGTLLNASEEQATLEEVYNALLAGVVYIKIGNLYSTPVGFFMQDGALSLTVSNVVTGENIRYEVYET